MPNFRQPSYSAQAYSEELENFSPRSDGVVHKLRWVPSFRPSTYSTITGLGSDAPIFPASSTLSKTRAWLVPFCLHGMALVKRNLGRMLGRLPQALSSAYGLLSLPFEC